MGVHNIGGATLAESSMHCNVATLKVATTNVTNLLYRNPKCCFEGINLIYPKNIYTGLLSGNSCFSVQDVDVAYFQEESKRLANCDVEYFPNFCPRPPGGLPTYHCKMVVSKTEKSHNLGFELNLIHMGAHIIHIVDINLQSFGCRQDEW